MTSNKPYIVRAFYQWIADNDLTPYIVVDTTVFGVIVPISYINNDQIVLNISSASVGAISLVGNEIELSARFGGKLEHLVVPFGAIAAIYAKENGAGTSLPIEHAETGSAEIKPKLAPTGSKAPVLTQLDSQTKSTTAKLKPQKSKSRASLKVIK